MADQFSRLALMTGLACSMLVAPGLASAQGSTADSQAIADRLAGAIRFETVSPEDPADFRGQPFLDLAAYLRRSYPRVHRSLRLEKVNDYTLLFEWKGSDPDRKPVLFMSHLDVVPVEPAAAAEWSRPPFSGVIEEGYVWGRGSLDVKVGVILWLETVEGLLREGFVPDRTVYLAFGHDEEIGGEHGARAVASRLREQGVELEMLFDEGGFIFDGYPLLPDQVTAQIITAEKTYFTVRLTARGVSGHSSVPPKHTAIGKLSTAIHRLEANPMPARLIPPVQEMLEVAAPHLSFRSRFAFGNLWLTGAMVERELGREELTASLVRTTFAATIFHGGVKDNVIPELAEATVNVRILPGDTPEDVIRHIRRAIDDPEIEIDSASWAAAPPPTPTTGAGYRLASDAIREVIPEAIVLPGLTSGATDSRHFAGLAAEIYRFLPARISMDLVKGFHGRDERIAVEHLGPSLEIATGLLRRAAGPRP